MDKLFEHTLFLLKKCCYPTMRRMATGMTNAYLPPVVPVRSEVQTSPTAEPIRLNIKSSRRVTWNRQLVRRAHG